MGKASKTKGRAQEYVLRNYLRSLGWTAERVPMSGALASVGKGDVKASRNGKDLLFEMKSRKSSFKTIYQLYDEHIRTAGDDLLAVAVPGAERLCLTLSSSLDAVLEGAEFHTLVTNHALYTKHKRTFSKLSNLQKLLGQADILAIKDDRRPLLFIRFI